MTLKPRKSVQFTPPPEMVGEEFSDAPAVELPPLTDPIEHVHGVSGPTPPHDWIHYFGTDTAFDPDLYPLQSDARLFVITGEFTKLNPARMTVGELIDAKDKLVAPVWYRVA